MLNTNTLKVEIEEDISFDEDFSKLLDQTIVEKEEGSIIKGIVVDIKKGQAIFDVGLKSEGAISLNEFKESLEIGDEFEVYLEKKETREGSVLISREKALLREYWHKFEEACEKKETVDGVINGRVKGGFTVDLGGVIAFLPGSQVDIRPVKDISPLIGVSQPFLVLKVDRKQGNIVVSRRAILEEERSVERDKLLSNINEGQILTGIVKNITDYGAFVDLGSIDGLLHVTDISWTRISHPSEVLALGQEVKVIIIKYNQDTKRISLGMKQLEDNPWAGIQERYQVGSLIKGKVTNIADYGAFVELEPGIEGLVHISEISWTKNTLHPRHYFTQGEEISVKVLDVDPEKHRISLGIKQCQDNPWRHFCEEFPVGSEVEGEIKNVVDFGIFVGFNDGIDGLVHISDVTWQENIEEELTQYKRGAKVKMKVLGVDVDKERISLGIKQLHDDPFVRLKKGSTVTCSVSEVRSDGIEVDAGDSMTAFIKKADLSRDKVEQRVERFAVGDRVDAKITGIDKTHRKLALSIKALEVDEHNKAIAEYGSTDSGASLGDILGAALGRVTLDEPSAADEKSTSKDAVEEKKPAKKKASPAKAKAEKKEKPSEKKKSEDKAE